MSSQAMNVYLINLDRSPDRLAWMSSRLNQLAITPVRVPAVDGRQLSADVLSRWESVRHPRFGMGPGEVACFLSHRRVWELIVSGNQPWGLVVEDDIHISDQLTKFITNDNWVPADAGIVKAETAKQRVWLSAERSREIHLHNLRVLRSHHGGSAAYFVSKETARWMLKETEDFCTTVDQLLFNPDFKIAKHLRIYQIDPALAAQDWAIDTELGAGAQATNGALESLLLAERNQYHGTKQPRSGAGISYLWYKLSNPLKKTGRRSIALAANVLGTHTVKKVPFVQRSLDAAA